MSCPSLRRVGFASIIGISVGASASLVAAFEPPFPHATAESQGIDPGALEALGAVVKGYIKTEAALGAELLVIKNRRTVFHEAYGWKDREADEPMVINTIFNIRSMTKPITGAAVQLLIDRGELKLDDRVAIFLPGFDNDSFTDSLSDGRELVRKRQVEECDD